VRKTTAILAAFALLAGLTACSSADTVAGCAPVLHSGRASTTVKATGKFGKQPKVTFPTALHTKTSQVSTLIAGKGAAIGEGQPVVIDFEILDGTTGAVLQKSTYTKLGSSLITTGDSQVPAISRGLICSQVGSRIAIVASPKDGHDGKADTADGIKKNDTIVYVLDVKNAFLAKANGAAQAPQNQFPAVVTSSKGQPGITIPSTAAPTKLETEVLKQGSGAKVKKNDPVVVQYTGVNWAASPAVFDSTWTTGKGQASVIQPGAASLSAGLSTALIGKRVGSRIVTVIPPKLATTSDGSGTAPSGATVVYAVDILGIVQ
jgi:FKBP-type peptidyl-prolyl cis-trans isomerase